MLPRYRPPPVAPRAHPRGRARARPSETIVTHIFDSSQRVPRLRHGVRGEAVAGQAIRAARPRRPGPPRRRLRPVVLVADRSRPGAPRGNTALVATVVTNVELRGNPRAGTDPRAARRLSRNGGAGRGRRPGPCSRRALGSAPSPSPPGSSASTSCVQAQRLLLRQRRRADDWLESATGRSSPPQYAWRAAELCAPGTGGCLPGRFGSS